MKVCNIGSLNIDYVYAVEHFVRPGETIGSARMDVFPGGKGLNQSVALSKAGAQTFHAGKVGREGLFLKETLADAGVDISMVQTVDEPNGHAIIQVNPSGQNCILLYGGANRQIDEPYVDAILSRFGRGDILLLQNEVNLLPYIVARAYETGMRIALNPSPFDDNINHIRLEHIRWFILNETEGRDFTGASDPEEIIDRLLHRFPDTGVMLTLGEKGSVYADIERRVSQDAFCANVVDTTAAGDTFTGFFLAGILQNQPLETTLRRASLASSIAVSRKGAAKSIPAIAEVIEAEKRIYNLDKTGHLDNV
jgi:ribokinase